MKVLMLPHVSSFRNEESGIRRVVEAYFRYLPQFGIDMVDPDATSYDLKAVHAGMTGGDCDVCHCHGLYWTADYVASMWEYKTNAKVIDAVRHAAEVTVPSWWVAEAFQRDMRFTPHVIPHGIELDEWKCAESHDGYVLWNKNRVGDVCSPDAVNVLAGLFDDINFVSTFALPGCPDNVTVTGIVPHDTMKSYVQHAMVYLSTAKETFGIGLLEAAASGVPVLGWACGGNTDIVVHKETGYLAVLGDYDDLADGLVYCMQHRNRLSEAARESVGGWTWDYAVGKVASVYERVVDEPPTVTIVIPYYNKSVEELSAAVRSAVSQDKYVANVVIIDDGSDSGHVVDEVADKYGVHVIRQANMGVAHARNNGIAAFDTKYVCCLDSDDAIEPTFVRKCVEELERDRSLGIAYTGLLLRSVGGDGVPYYSQGKWPQQFNYGMQSEGKNQIPTCCVFRRKMWERLGGYNPKYCPDGAGVEDAEFWLRCGAYGWGAKKVTDDPLFMYAWGGSTTGTRGYQGIDWTTMHPWTKDGRHPFASVAVPHHYSHAVRQYDQPVVSVIIPVGPGHETEVENVLDGLEAQIFRQWEAIVVWDSTNTENIGKLRTVYPYAIVVETGGGAGAGAARNFGVEYARAGLLLFNDADDWLYPNAIERMLEEYSRTPGIIYSNYDGKAIISDESKLNPDLRKRIKARDKEYTILGYIAADYDCERAQKQPEGDSPYIWCNVTCLVPVAWHYEIGGFDERLESWEDVDYHWRMARHGKCYYHVDENLLMYRFTTGNRREDGYTIRRENVDYMRHKYKREGESMTGCRGCGKSSRPTSTERSAMIANRPLPVSGMQDIKGGTVVNQIQLPKAIGGVVVVSESDLVMARYNSRTPTDHKVVGPNTMILYGYRKDGDVMRVHRSDIGTGKFTEVVQHVVTIAPPLPPRVPQERRPEPKVQESESPVEKVPKDESEPGRTVTGMSAADIREVVKSPTVTYERLRAMHEEEKKGKKRAYVVRLLEVEMQRWEK